GCCGQSRSRLARRGGRRTYYQASAGRLGCVSCHEPHSSPCADRRDAVYRQAYLNCHTAPAAECREKPPARLAAGDNCTACHMPAFGSSDIAQTAVTDHRLLRRPGATAAAKPRAPPRGQEPLVL